MESILNKKQLLMLALGVLSLTGCASKATFGMNSGRTDETRSAIQQTIPDLERQAAMQELVEAYKHEVEEIANQAVALRLQIIEGNRDYDTPRGELQRLYDELGQQLELLSNAAKIHSFELRAFCTEEEWKQIASQKTNPVHFEF